jgi:hypothetical protein
MTITIKVGGFYKRRDGRIAGPMHPIGPEHQIAAIFFPFEVDGTFYSSTGFVMGPLYPVESDLIQEVPPPEFHGVG